MTSCSGVITIFYFSLFIMISSYSIVAAIPTDCTCIEYMDTIDSDYPIPVSEVIELIEKGKDKFYVMDYKTQNKVYVNVAQKKEGMKYIRTEAYDTSYDRLLKVGYCNVTRRAPYESGPMIIQEIRDLLDS